MTVAEAPPRGTVRSDLGYAYLMMGIAIGCIVVSGVLGSIFTPNLVSTSGTATGYAHQQVPLAAYMGWTFDVIALWMLLAAAMPGIRARVTDRAPWTLLGLGVGGIWLAVMFVSIFTPVMVTGTAPWITKVPLASILSVLAGLLVTGLLCKSVKASYFEPAPRSMDETNQHLGLDTPRADDPATKLRQLAQLRDCGAITESDFERKKDELLNRI